MDVDIGNRSQTQDDNQSRSMNIVKRKLIQGITINKNHCTKQLENT